MNIRWLWIIGLLWFGIALGIGLTVAYNERSADMVNAR